MSLKGWRRYIGYGAMLVLIALAPLVLAETPDAEQLGHRVMAAYTAMEEGRNNESERIFMGVLQEDPSHMQARFGLGTLYIKMERYDRAIRLLESLYKEFPQEFVVLNNLGWLYATATDHKVRDGERAVQLAQEALLMQPNAFHIWSTLAEGYYVLGNYERSQRAAREAVRLSQSARVPEAEQERYRQQYLRSRRAAESVSVLD